MIVQAPKPVVRIEYRVQRHPDEQCAQLIERIEFHRKQAASAEEQLKARLKEIG
ncbi:MAG TPA: hypothetical protein VKZ49_04640 [Polyangiaceae bacterium]|nr:hypothetical protein [Polyangiaceae bacterium]